MCISDTQDVSRAGVQNCCNGSLSRNSFSCWLRPACSDLVRPDDHQICGAAARGDMLVEA